MTQPDTTTDEPGDQTSAEEFLDRVRQVVELLAEAVDEESDTTAAEAVEDAREIVDETEELLDTVDLSELLDAVDFTEVPEAVDADDLPEAVAEGEPRRAFDLTDLLEAVDLTELWGATDVREFRRNLRELQDAADDSEHLDVGTGDDDGDGLVDGDVTDEVDVDVPGTGDTDGVPSEVAETAAQRKVRKAAGEARERMLEVRDRLKEETEAAYEEVEERTREADHPSSRNPTAVSTLAVSGGGGRQNAAAFSSVPAETLHSDTPNPERVYGDAMDEEGGDGNG